MFTDRYSSFLAFLFFALIWGTFFFSTGTVTSGYHFQDDHEILRVDKEYEKSDFWPVAKKFTMQIVSIRLRWYYQFQRAVKIWVLGDNLVAWGLYNIGLLILTCWFLFRFCQAIGFSYFESFLFPFIALLGVQAAIWWRLAPAETPGVFFLSLALLWMAKSVFGEKRNLVNKSLSVVALVIATLTKESFILFIPGFVLLYIFLKSQKEGQSFFKAVFGNIWFAVFMGLIMIVELLFVVVLIGSNTMGYAGVDNSFDVVKLLRDGQYLIRNHPVTWISAAAFILLIIKTCVETGSFMDGIKTLWRKHWEHAIALVVLFVAIVLPQFVLYQKSGLGERYWIPAIFGFSLVAIYLLKFLRESGGTTLRWQLVSYVVVGFAVLWQTGISYARAIGFTEKGHAIETMFETVISNSKPGTVNLFVMDPAVQYEEGGAIMIYLEQHNLNEATIYQQLSMGQIEGRVIAVDKGLTSAFQKSWGEIDISVVEDKSLIQNVAILEDLEDEFMAKNADWFEQPKFHRHPEMRYTNLHGMEQWFVVFSRK